MTEPIQIDILVLTIKKTEWLGDAILQEQTKYWVTESEEDILTAKVLLKSKRLLESAFFCHLAIEKILKAFIAERKNEIPPKDHNLLKLAKRSGIHKELDEGCIDLLAELQPFNIEERYPETRERLFKDTPEKIFIKIVSKTEDKLQWFKQVL